MFAYLAIDSDDRRHTGIVPAVSREQVLAALRAAHLIPVSVQPVR